MNNRWHVLKDRPFRAREHSYIYVTHDTYKDEIRAFCSGRRAFYHLMPLIDPEVHPINPGQMIKHIETLSYEDMCEYKRRNSDGTLCIYKMIVR